MQADNRRFSSYELTQLQRHSISLAEAKTHGEMPIEYITGHVDFAGLDLLVNQNVLIPRVETEELVELVITEVTKKFEHQKVSIAEIGTGSGAITLAIAQKLMTRSKEFEISAGDISEAALKVAQQNRDRIFGDTLSKTSLSFIHSDLWQNFPTRKFDMVIANLPYIPQSRLPELDDSVIDFEPKLALDGGPDGSQLIKKLLQTSSAHLKPHAEIFLEIDETHTQEHLQSLAPAFHVTLIDDQFQKTRFAKLELITNA